MKSLLREVRAEWSPAVQQEVASPDRLALSHYHHPGKSDACDQVDELRYSSRHLCLLGSPDHDQERIG
jgi:hypothetical protein